MQRIFTFIAEILPDRAPRLQGYLESLAPKGRNSGDLPLEKIAGLHYASLLIVRDPTGTFPQYLVFENNIDGTIDAYIDQLCSVAPKALDRMFSKCKGYGDPVNAGAVRDTARRRKYLREILTLPNAAFVGNVGRSLSRIVEEKKLVEVIEDFVDTLPRPLPGSAPKNLFDAVRSAVARGNAWALQPKRQLSKGGQVGRWLSFLALIPIGLAVLLVPPFAVILTWRKIQKPGPPPRVTCVLLAAPTLALLTTLLIHEMRDKADTSRLSPQSLLRITKNEDQRRGQNHFASVSVVKPGGFRRGLLWVVLFVIGRIARTYVNGTLGDLDNIHFAQWVLLDGGRRLMFLTNYDGSWENYLDDFIDVSAAGLTAIWSNTVGFPKAWGLFLRGGARKEREFKNSARRTQISEALWYEAYQGLTVTSIQNNTEIRNGLATPPRGSAIDAWLQRL